MGGGYRRNTLKPTLFPLMSRLLSGVLISGGKRCISIVEGDSAAAVLSPDGMLVPGNEHRNEVDINHFHVPLSLFIWVFCKLPRSRT